MEDYALFVMSEDTEATFPLAYGEVADRNGQYIAKGQDKPGHSYLCRAGI